VKAALAATQLAATDLMLELTLVDLLMAARQVLAAMAVKVLA
jgi:hypothetical protein